jgi:hypothetical protein
MKGDEAGDRPAGYTTVRTPARSDVTRQMPKEARMGTPMAERKPAEKPSSMSPAAPPGMAVPEADAAAEPDDEEPPNEPSSPQSSHSPLSLLVGAGVAAGTVALPVPTAPPAAPDSLAPPQPVLHEPSS